MNKFPAVLKCNTVNHSTPLTPESSSDDDDDDDETLKHFQPFCASLISLVGVAPVGGSN